MIRIWPSGPVLDYHKQLEKSGHRISESVTTFRAPQRLDLHMVAQHELVGVRMEVNLLVDRKAVVANPTYRTGLKRQDPFTVRYQLPAASHIR